MNLHIGVVVVNGAQKGTGNSLIPNGSIGTMEFAHPVSMYTGEITVAINFQMYQNNGMMFGYGQINYQGPNYLPSYDVPLPP
jgi:hypothetical protein